MIALEWKIIMEQSRCTEKWNNYRTTGQRSPEKKGWGRKYPMDVGSLKKSFLLLFLK